MAAFAEVCMTKTHALAVALVLSAMMAFAQSPVTVTGTVKQISGVAGESVPLLPSLAVGLSTKGGDKLHEMSRKEQGR